MFGLGSIGGGGMGGGGGGAASSAESAGTTSATFGNDQVTFGNSGGGKSLPLIIAGVLAFGLLGLFTWLALRKP